MKLDEVKKSNNTNNKLKKMIYFVSALFFAASIILIYKIVYDYTASEKVDKYLLGLAIPSSMGAITLFIAARFRK